MKMINSRGFTLIEMLIVLSIISIITTIVMVSFSSLHKSYETQKFIEQLEMDLYYAQQLAMNTGKVTYIIFNTNSRFYGIRQQNQILYRRDYKEHIRFESETIRLDEVMFNANGNISRSGTIAIRIHDERYILVFTLGKGRFYIEKR